MSKGYFVNLWKWRLGKIEEVDIAKETKHTIFFNGEHRQERRHKVSSDYKFFHNKGDAIQFAIDQLKEWRKDMESQIAEVNTKIASLQEKSNDL